MQQKENYNIEERTLFYGGKVISHALEKGQDYKYLPKITMISILDYELKETDDYITQTVRIGNENIKCRLVNGITYYFIELPKFRRSKKKKTKLHDWLTFIDYKNMKELKEVMERNENVKKANEEYERLRKEREERAIEYFKEKAEIDEYFAAVKAYHDGEKAGEKKRRKETERKSGEQQKEIEILLRMAKLNYTIEEMMEITGMTENEINSVIGTKVKGA